VSGLDDLSRSLDDLLSDLEPVQHAMGQAGKKVALEQFERDLGADRSFSGMRRKVKLGAGYDTGTPVVLNMRPAGLVLLADKGRQRSGKIMLRRRGKARALKVPGTKGRGSSRYGPTRGFDTVTKIENKLSTEVPKAVEKDLSQLIDRRL